MILKLNPSKACGPNSIPTNLLKTHSNSFLKPLKEVINKSLFQGSFPTLLKYAQVCPIYKNNDKGKCENYRPISLLSNISKLLCTPDCTILLNAQICFMKNNLDFEKNTQPIMLY